MRSPAPLHAKSSDESPLIARLAPREMAVTSAAPRWIQWMPGGIHQINATQGGKPVQKRIIVDRGTAAAAEQALRQHLAAGRQRPYLDFDHQGGEASAWVVAFEWQDTPEPGVYVQVEWSQAGEEAVLGRTYRAFSPSFFVNAADPARVTGVPFVMGGLVNDPAFRGIHPLWARQASGSQRPDMNKRTKLAALLGVISTLQQDRTTLAAKSGEDHTAAIQAKDSEITAKLAEARVLQEEINAEAQPGGDGLKVEIADATATLQAKDAEIEQLRAKVTDAEAQLKARREVDAEAAVTAAVERGAIPAADKALQASWQADLVANPDARKRLDAIAGHPALSAGRITASGAVNGSGVRITREDSVAVVKAYAAERDPMLRGRIFARDLSPRIAGGEMLPIDAATNTLGTLAADLVSQRALELLTLQFPMLTSISTDFSAEPVKYGKKVSTRIVSVPTVGTYHTTNGYVSQDTTTTDVDVPIDSHKFVQHEFGANELSGTTRNLWNEMAPAMAYALGKDLVDALYALITAANYTATATTVTLANFDRGGVIKLAKALTARGVPPVNRTLLLNSDYYAALAEDPAIVSLAAYQQAAVITAGQLPPVHGFKVMEAVNLPTTGNLTGFASYPSAWAMAVRLPAEYVNSIPGATGGGVTTVITEPNTGLSIQQVSFIDHKLGKAYSRVAWMYGVAKADINAGQRLVSS